MVYHLRKLQNFELILRTKIPKDLSLISLEIDLWVGLARIKLNNSGDLNIAESGGRNIYLSLTL